MLDIRELMNLKEAYAEVYAPQELTEEQVWEEVEEWVNTLIEEGYDLSDYTWEEMFEAYLEEQGGGGSTAPRNQNVFKFPTSSAGSRRGAAAGTRTPTSTSAPSGANSGQFGRYVPGSQQVKTSPATAPAKPTPPATTPTKPAPATAKPAPTATRPAASSLAPKPAAATAPAAKPSAGEQFAKANPKLAASAAERDRTRGTSATTNPLMKDMKSRLPAPKTPSPTTAKTGFDLAKKGVNLAAGFDMFDVVKGYLIGEGYADTEESALAIMANMSEEWREDIVELYKGKHGQSEKEYMDDRSQGGKMISGDSKESGASYSHRSFRGQGKPVKPGKRQPAQGKMDSGTRADIQYRKANLKNR
jgi:hypothetical protein